MQLRIRSITYLAEDINGYEFVDPNGHDLPRFAAGAHVGVRLGDAGREGVWRDYSLWNDPAERRRYCIAVLREGEGSRRLHEEMRAGRPDGGGESGLGALAGGQRALRVFQRARRNAAGAARRRPAVRRAAGKERRQL